MMNEKQLILLNFIKRFNKICVDNNIEYFIGAGTALGAIRHKGFLPWDDDIDLCMKRDEWLRAKPILKEVLGDDLVIVDTDDYPEYKNPIVRIVDIKATEFTRSRLIDGTPHGMQLEIFILDPIPESEIGQGQYYSDFWLYCEALTNNFIVANKALNMEHFPIDVYLKNKSVEEKKALVKELEKKLFHYSEEECDYYHFRWGIEWIVYPKKTFEKQLWVDFEDTKLPVASGFATEFFTDYGDTWMVIPTVDDQLVHDTIENYHVPYTEYENIFKKVIDIKDTSRSRALAKRNNIIKVYNDDFVRRLYLYHDNVKASIKYASGSDLRGKALDAIGKKDYDAADEALELLYTQQEKSFERYMLATADMELLGAALEARFVKGDWRFVEKVRKIIVNKPELITEKIRGIFEIVKTAREAYFSQYYNKESEYKEVVQSVLDEYPEQVNMIEMKHLIDCYDAQSNKEICLKELDSLSQDIKDRPVIIMLKIYCLTELGRREEAEAIYDGVKDVIRNGMVLLKLKEILGY